MTCGTYNCPFVPEAIFSLRFCGLRETRVLSAVLPSPAEETVKTQPLAPSFLYTPAPGITGMSLWLQLSSLDQAVR